MINRICSCVPSLSPICPPSLPRRVLAQFLPLAHPLGSALPCLNGSLRFLEGRRPGWLWTGFSSGGAGHHTFTEWETFRKSAPCTPLFHQTSSSTFSKAIKKVKSKHFLKNELKMSHPGREYTRKQLLSLSSVSIWGGRFGVNLGETSMVAAREGTGLGMRGRF